MPNGSGRFVEMRFRYYKLLAVLTAVLLSMPTLLARDGQDERHVGVALRLIGHEILLASGDSTSRVLPVEQDGDRYRLRFEQEFSFEPDRLVVLIDSIVRKSQLAGSYLVEMEECLTGVVVYSYERNPVLFDLVPCKNRVQPKACYSLLFTILDKGHEEAVTPGSPAITKDTGTRSYLLTGILLLTGVAGFLYLRKKRKQPDPNVITLGAYRFDTRNMELSIQNEKIELTGKESDLLLLLYTSANHTVEREVILNAVWGDEGDYEGRTLDVFISKLRRKLEADSSLRIVNIRGVGYKLIVNG